MRGRSTLVGAAFATVTAVTWGGQFVVGKSALDRVNAFPLSTIRYAGAAALWLIVLAVVEGRGDALVLAGVFSFVLYGLGAAQLRDFSPLRYTTLTAALGWLTMAAATAVALGAGLVPVPSGSALLSTTPQIAYLALPGAFIAVLTWNAAIGLIGAQNAVLFGNLIPVTTFAIKIVRGYRPNAVELAGAALTIAALVANNLAARRQAAAPAGQRMDYEYAEAA